MNTQDVKTQGATALLHKPDARSPAIIVQGPQLALIKAGVIIGGNTFGEDTPLPLPQDGLVAGEDYAAAITPDGLRLMRLTSADISDPIIFGGFHFAPGGCASARAGGDSVAQINPWSSWDRNFMPACGDPRGMIFERPSSGELWADVYMLGTNHMTDGTSKFGSTIADGDDPPQNPEGGNYDCFDFATAVACYKHHRKTLFAVTELFEIAIGGTERTACDRDPKINSLDMLRTSRRGLMRPFGSMWQWCTDGDPDVPRASIFGGSWMYGESAGSRYADVAYRWPGRSNDGIGARGRSDHLQLG